jgi:hypothetical protein
MPYITDHKQKFDDLNSHIKNQDQLRKQANGGSSSLFSYEPGEETLTRIGNEILMNHRTHGIDRNFLEVTP